MQQTRRDFIRTVGTLTIGFCLTGEATIWPSPTQTLPGDLRENPRINAWLEILADGHVRVLTGKIELGQGIRTAVAQMAAEELDLDMSQVEVLLAETGRTPDEGYTAGSNSIEASAIAVRYAAAAARQKLIQLAAQKWNTPADRLEFAKGVITDKTGHRNATLAEILDNRQITDEVRMPVTLKQKEKYQYIGKAVPRDDVKRIVTGQPVYVHDLEFPNMLHARVIHPPVYGAQINAFDQQSVKSKLPDITLTVNGSFLAVLAPTEYSVIKAHDVVQNAVKWSSPEPLPDIQPAHLPAYLRTLPVQTERVTEKGDTTPLKHNATLKATYFKPYIMHGAIGPSCAVAHYENGKLDIWSHSQGVYPLRETIAALLHLSPDDIHVKGTPGSGCYGHNGADDAAAEAALLAVANPGRHIRVQWSREDEHGWEPYGSAMLMDLEAIVLPSGKITHWNYALRSDTHGTRPGGNPANLLPAHYIENPIAQKPSGYSGGAYRNAEPYYAIPNRLVEAHFFTGPLRASSLRSLGAYANIYAIESFMDELAGQVHIDPIEFRLQNLDDPRAKEVLLQLQKQIPPNQQDIGIAFSRYKNSGAYCAVAAQSSINKSTGAPTIKKMWAVIDAGEVINLDGIKNQIEGGMIQSASWTLYEQVLFNKDKITSRAWSTYPVMHINQAPEVAVTVIDRPDQPPFGAGEAAQGPAAAAIVNAIHKACGQRIRMLPVGKIQTPRPA
ncbi:MAG TPA: molybdopterin cofactor-binding domain-containing protein [Puia sp.]|uniref:molybdopterin cofactor-binding domain-containing protein n=1 Tax=Puia sp. TaxID=2045100 RepID=UPI002CC85282|nr:molybdopterin cofactor-binding domain-containing protein [Puia sp.]HVU96025.1 molybdopterin cofactor-binding domain-containing protein [Puia sp.]